MYKYYSIKDLDVLENIIGNQSSIKFASAFNLNDPNELKFSIIISDSEKHRDNYFKSNPHKTSEDFNNWKREEKQNLTWYTAQETRNDLAQKIGLASFSEKCDNNLMWSHYTKNHEGICVEYSSSLVESVKPSIKFMAAMKVKYSDIPPKIDLLADPALIAKQAMFNKQLDWEYEKEFRIVVLSDEDDNYTSIGQKLIQRVIIGSRASGKLRDRVIEICNKDSIEIYQAITMGNTYDVTIKKYKEGTIYTTSFWGAKK